MTKTLVSLAVAAGLLAGCGGLDGGDLIRAGAPTGQILVVNGSSSTLTAITVSTCENFTHGLNRLPSGTTIQPGERYSFTVSNGCYDVQAGYGWGTGYALADFNDIYVPAGGVYTLTVN